MWLFSFLLASCTATLPLYTLSLGPKHACSIQAQQNAVYCWGDNEFGQLGIGSFGGVHGVTRMLNSANVISVVCTEKATCVLVTLGVDILRVFCTGDNTYGQLGRTGPARHTIFMVADIDSNFNNQFHLGWSDLNLWRFSGMGSTYCVTGIAIGLAWGVCWGDNAQGQFGNGFAGIRPTPEFLSRTYFMTLSECQVETQGLCQAVPASCQAFINNCLATSRIAQNTQTHVGGGSICIKTLMPENDYTIRCAGANDVGQLGDGTTTNRNVFVRQSGRLADISFMAMGGNFGCVIIPTTLAFIGCWGNNIYGQLQPGDTYPIAGTFSTARNPIYDFFQQLGTEMTLGGSHACVLRGTGVTPVQPTCVGFNNLGQLGVPSPTISVSQPRVLFAGGQNAAITVAAYDRTCYQNADGEIYCTEGTFITPMLNGVVGIPATESPTRSPTNLPTKSPTTTLPTKSPTTTLPTKSPTFSLPTGAPSTTPSKSPTLPTGAPTNSPVLPFSPYTFPLAASIQAPAGTGDSLCTIQMDTNVYCSGSNNVGQLGLGFVSANVLLPTRMVNSFGAVSIAAVYSTVCVLIVDGVACTGSNSRGQLGVPSTTASTALLLTVPGLSLNVVSLAAAFSVSDSNSQAFCVILVGGPQFCWGSSNAGKLGSGAAGIFYTPTAVQSGSGALTMAVGLDSGCIITLSNAVMCVGNNALGQLGDGGGGSSLTFVQTFGLLFTVSQISLGETHACAYSVDVGVVCWGGNAYGQLGDGTFTNRLVPVPSLGLFPVNITRIAAGRASTLVLLANYTARCYGLSEFGTCRPSATRELLPTPVLYHNGFNGIIAMTFYALNSSGTCVLLSSRTVFCTNNTSPYPLVAVPDPFISFAPTRSPTLNRTSSPSFPTFAPTTVQPSTAPTRSPTGMPYISLRPTTSAPTQKPNTLGKCAPQPPVDGVNFCCYNGFNMDVRFAKTPGCPLADGYITGPFGTFAALAGILLIIAFAQLYWQMPFTALRGVAFLMALVLTAESVTVIFFNRFSASSAVLNSAFLLLLLTAFSLANMPSNTLFVSKTAIYAVVAVGLVVPSTATGVAAGDAVIWIWCSVLLLACVGEGVAMSDPTQSDPKWAQCYVLSALLAGVVLFLPTVSDAWQTQLCLGLLKVWLLFFVMSMAVLIPTTYQQFLDLYKFPPLPELDVESELANLLKKNGVNASGEQIHAFIASKT